MKIANVETMVLGTAWRNLTIAVVRTDDGIEGLGEVRMLNHTDALLGYLHEAVPRHVLGSDPLDVESLVQRMTRSDYARPGEIAMSAAAIIEIACWDIMGKACGQPVYRLLGGAVRDRIKAYANGWYQVDRTPQEFYSAARRAIDKGYQAVKVDPFGNAQDGISSSEWRLSVSLVESVREAIGADAELMIEMHGRAPGNPKVVDGHFALPEGPGLGVTLDRDLVARHPRRPVFFDLHKEGWQLRQAEVDAT